MCFVCSALGYLQTRGMMERKQKGRTIERFLFKQEFRKFRNGNKWYGNFQKIPKFLIFWKAGHSTEYSGNRWTQIKWNGNFGTVINSGVPREVVLCFWKFREMLYHSSPEIQTRIFRRMEIAPRQFLSLLLNEIKGLSTTVVCGIIFLAYGFSLEQYFELKTIRRLFT